MAYAAYAQRYQQQERQAKGDRLGIHAPLRQPHRLARQPSVTTITDPQWGARRCDASAFRRACNRTLEVALPSQIGNTLQQPVATVPFLIAVADFSASASANPRLERSTDAAVSVALTAPIEFCQASGGGGASGGSAGGATGAGGIGGVGDLGGASGAGIATGSGAGSVGAANGRHPTGRQPAAGTPEGTMEPEHRRKGLAPISLRAIYFNRDRYSTAADGLTAA